MRKLRTAVAPLGMPRGARSTPAAPPAARPAKGNEHRTTGFLHWVFPAILFMMCADALLSNRDLSQQFTALSSMAEPTRHPAMQWVQRCVSLLLLLASVEQITNRLSLDGRPPSVILTFAFVTYWLCNVASPGLFGTHPRISHELLYSLAIGGAACLVGVAERDRILDAARNGLFAVLALGVALIAVKPSLVLDLSYSQGMIPGLPRFAGATPHPVTQGLLAQVTLLLLWCRPFERRWLNRMAWTLGLFVLFIAQSKTAWVAFIVAGACVWTVRSGGGFWRRMSDPRRNSFGLLVCFAVAAVVLAVASWILIGDAAGKVEDFVYSSQGSQLISMTGRDRIWAAALEEWRNNPTFGYGLSLWDAVYRASIGMPNATHAHNQFMDDLARSGTIGATALVFYAAVLLVLSVRYAKATGGLSLALFVGIAMRSVSEVPLSLLGYGTELFAHLLLLVTISAAASANRRPAPARSPLRYGVAS